MSASNAKGTDYLSRYKRNTPGSLELHEEARRYIPGGVSHNHRYHGPYPLFFSRAKGSRIWDVDEREYLDLWMAHYDAILGHAPSAVLQKVQDVMMNGQHVGLAMEHEVALARKVCELVPSAERVRFCSSGTEATMYAVRLARGFTGRNVILKMVGGWHGANTDLMVDVAPPEFIGPECKGLLPGVEKYTRAVQFNDIEDTARAIREAGDDWAGIILEPAMGTTGFLPAEREYLDFVREETRKRGALMILDEIITGFRLAPGGAQEAFGVMPDLCTLGKVLGGGMPVGAVAGRADVMEISAIAPDKSKRDKVVVGGGTYSANPLSMVAGLTTLEILERGRDEIYPQLASGNAQLCQGMRDAFADAGIPVLVTEVGSLQELHFVKEAGLPVRNTAEMLSNTYPELRQELAGRLRNHGVFLYHGGALSTAHTGSDIDKMVKAYRACAGEMADSRAA